MPAHSGFLIDGHRLTAAKHVYSGTHRTRPPEETLAANRPLMPRLGITRLADVTGLDRIGLPVCVAVRPNARALSTSQGKGMTMAAARVSALMEAIETWHGERIQGPVTIGTCDELAAAGAVDPTLLAVRADATYDARRPLEWLTGWDLLAGRPALVPYEAVSTNFVEPAERRPVFLKSTNGLASGNHLLEAIVHALLEVIERDALTLWSLLTPARQAARRVDPATIADPTLAGLLARLAAVGVAALIEDCTSDLGVPVFSCTLADDPRSAFWRGVPRAGGHGAHLDPVVALGRAIFEAVQSRATLIGGSRDDVFQRDYANSSSRDDDLAWTEEAAAAARRFEPSPVACHHLFEGDLAFLLARLRAAGIANAIACDLTRPEIGVVVVKLLVPGLEPARTSVYRQGARARAFVRAEARR